MIDAMQLGLRIRTGLRSKPLEPVRDRDRGRILEYWAGRRDAC